MDEDIARKTMLAKIPFIAQSLRLSGRTGTISQPMADAESETPKPAHLYAYDLSPFAESEQDPADLTMEISWAEAQSGLGKMLIQFQLLETTIKDAIAFFDQH